MMPGANVMFDTIGAMFYVCAPLFHNLIANVEADGQQKTFSFMDASAYTMAVIF